jgi:hypothetical protein
MEKGYCGVPAEIGLGLSVVTVLMMLTVAGCGPDHNGHALVVGHKPLVTSPGSGLFAVDCTKELAYVPLRTADIHGNSQIAVINLAVDPDVTDPRIATIATTHPDNVTGTALDNTDSLIIAVSGETAGQDGKVDVIDEKTNTLVTGSPFAFPAGSQAGFFGQVLFNPTTHKSIMSTCVSSSCSSGNPLTGFALFDPVAHTFGSVIPANYAETFAWNSATNVVIDASDADASGIIGAVDVSGARGCNLADSNIGSDQDGSSVDATTNIAVVSNEDGTATVINLHGSSFSPSSGTPCSLNEGGTAPNSVLVSSLPGATAGSAVDPVSHQAFLIEDAAPGVTLLQLPSSPVAQLTSVATPQISSIPNDPTGATWATQGDPYAVAIASCKNLPLKGFAIDGSFKFLVEVDLATLKSNPASISTALPAGSCTGTSTTHKCDNGSGVVFFPLPGV